MRDRSEGVDSGKCLAPGNKDCRALPGRNKALNDLCCQLMEANGSSVFSQVAAEPDAFIEMSRQSQSDSPVHAHLPAC